MRMESFELDLVKGIIERIAQEKINDKPFDLIRFHTVLKMIKDRCWENDIVIEYGAMEIGYISCYPCGLIVQGSFYEGERKRNFRILYEQSTGTMRFIRNLYGA